MIKNTQLSLYSLLFLLFSAGCQTIFADSDLKLAIEGKTDYVIVKPGTSSKVDNYAVKELAKALANKTGAKFPVVSPEKLPKQKNYIFVGMSAPALKILGKNPLNELDPQEYVVRNIGDIIFFYGEGKHGNFHAVTDFIDNELERRWYSEFDRPTFTITPNLTVKPFHRKEGFAFTYRLFARANLFGYHHGMNMCYSEMEEKRSRRLKKEWFPYGVESLKFNPAFVHTSFNYIPPSPEKMTNKDQFEWVKNKNYFKTNPDFFSMDKSGKRVANRQLCFANPLLREELTKNILKHIDRVGNDVIITVDANDSTGKFCHCPECLRLEEKYRSPGGPFYDYLFELCELLKKQHSKIIVKTHAYRTSQTQKTPKMPKGKKFPDNLIVVFSNVEDKLNADWNDAINRRTYEDLKAWRKLTKRLWTWYYPNPYGPAAFNMPIGNIERITNDLKMMKEAGVEGVFFEFTSPKVYFGDDFAPLQQFLFCKQTKNIDCDIDALVREFTDYQYGAAAPLARKYLHELEEARKNIKVHINLIPGTLDFKRQFAYLNDKNIYRWQKYFDEMEKKTVSEPRCLKNIQRLRRALELATLAKWNDLKKTYPDYFKDYLVHKKRLGSLFGREKPFVDDIEIIIKTNGIEKPLPEQFSSLNPSLVRRFIPKNKRNNTKQKRVVLDPEAAFGYAATVDLPDMPFNFGFYQNDRKKFCNNRELKAKDIKPESYQVYDLGEITVTPECMIWFSNRSCLTNLSVGKRLYEPGEDNKYNVYVSLKFDGPSYGGKDQKDQVLCDQIIFLKKDGQ